MESDGSKFSSGLKTMQLNDQKAGMQGLDKDMINKIIFEASKGTPYFAFQEKRQKSIDSKINDLQASMKHITNEQLKESLEKMTTLGISLENERDLSHSIVHIDMDAFYAAVEMQDNPELKDKPMAVGSLSMLSTSNYHARKFGVRAAMPGFIAKKLCPELIIVPVNFDKYRKMSAKIRNVVKEYDPDYCPASLDEMYLDLTEYIRQQHKKELHETHCLKNDLCDTFSNEQNVNECEVECDTCMTCCQPISDEKRDEMAFNIVKEIRTKINNVTQLTCSAGIAPNTMLAKVCSDQNKPNGQYQIHSNVEAVKSFISTLPVKKVSGIGPVQGQILNSIGIQTCSDIWEKRDLVDILFSPSSVEFYVRVSLGIGSTQVKSDYIRKSIGVEQTFREISKREDLFKKSRELCDEMIDDLKSHGMVGKIVVLKIKTSNFETHTRNYSLKYHTSDEEIIWNAAKKLLDSEIAAVAPEPLKLRLMGIRMASLVDENVIPKSERQPLKLKEFLQAKAIKSPVKNSETYTCPVCSVNLLCSSSAFSDHINDCMNSENADTTLTVNNVEVSNSNIENASENLCSSVSESNNLVNRDSVQYVCPVCGYKQNVTNLIKFNEHIDACLNKAAIKEILATDTLLEKKRKLSSSESAVVKEIKQGKLRKIEDYFH